MFPCICRKKNGKASKLSSKPRLLNHLHMGASNALESTNFVSLPDSVVESLVPGLQWFATPFWPQMGYTLSPDTSNNPEPSVANLENIDASQVTYVDPSEIWKESAALFIKGAADALAVDFSDVNQGALGDCWMMAAIAALARYGIISTGTTVPEESFVSIFPSGATNPQSVTIKLYQPDYNNYGRTTSDNSITQTIDTKIPVRNDQPLFVTSDETGEYWPCMMEKAVAAALTRTRSSGPSIGYAACVGGYTEVGMSLFTPGFPLTILGVGTSAATLFTFFDTCMATGVTLSASWKVNPDGGYCPSGEPYGYYGLVAGHAYTCFSIVNVGGYQLGSFRNPWGKGVQGNCVYNQISSDSGEFTGDWSDCSPQWNDNPTVKAACGYTGPRSDGFFWMSFDDVAKYIKNVGMFIPDRPELRAVDLRPSPFVSGPSPSAA